MSDLIRQFQIADPFWKRYENLLTDVVIPYQEAALRDQIPDAEKSHSIENFKMAADVMARGAQPGEYYGMVFQDSDLAKWIEAAAYSLVQKPDADLEARLDEVITTIQEAQYPDGYLNTYFTLKRPDKKWTNLREAHELYCAGHMIEAAVAYYEATGKRTLLDVMCRMADHIYERFVVQQMPGYPGHPEIELALMRLYRATGNEKYLELAAHFINVRGVDPDYFLKENETNGWCVWSKDAGDVSYMQAHKPVRDMTVATGHAVRAVYLFTGMADLAATTGDASLVEACQRLWDNIANKQMYITGGIGSTVHGEAFTKDYDLPNATAYAETCASIGLMFFARKMLDLEAKGNYADVMERALYNTVLAGMQLDGQRFFYVNPLEVIPGVSGEVPGYRHALPQRPKWYGCACCPPNVTRTIASIAKYAWGVKDKVAFSHLFLGGKLDLTEELGARISVQTKYPYEGSVIYELDGTPITLAVRIPEWSSHTKMVVDGVPMAVRPKDGYQYIQGASRVELYLDMEPKRYYANPMITADSGFVAIQRGPLVYCAEGVDNEEDIFSLRLPADGAIEVKEMTSELCGTVKLVADGYSVQTDDSLYSTTRQKLRPTEIVMVPYYTWANRGLNKMRVWLPEL